MKTAFYRQSGPLTRVSVRRASTHSEATKLGFNPLNGKANPCLHFLPHHDTGLSLSDETSKLKFLNIERA